ncbi:hypothetical protein DSL72_008856 [Monilinia vaccinii-corymbosi]|uniref:Uncharacterized protein n=1 Tax=Monilinia vaccinii-corymbosi TaxID=61207 RepID=A0A8A3PQE9_9HELO|nr:hypothetical protein DSL72_008856 [Monilinia vaccinii-corymbosi]
MAAAFDPNLTSESEPYLHDCNPIAPKGFAKDNKLAKSLWILSEEIEGEKFPLEF